MDIEGAELFKQTLEFCNLKEIDCLEGHFTWTNDRAFGNAQWLQLFDHRRTHVLPMYLLEVHVIIWQLIVV